MGWMTILEIKWQKGVAFLAIKTHKTNFYNFSVQENMLWNIFYLELILKNLDLRIVLF